MFDGLADWLQPIPCLSPCAAGGVLDEEDDDGVGRREGGLSASVPRILRGMAGSKSGSASRRLSSLRELYELTQDDDGGQRCVELVCTSSWDVVTALSSCLTASLDVIGGEQSEEDREDEDEDEDEEVRRLALLTLNNLSIPHDNKAVMSLGAASDALLGALTRVMDRRYHAQSYLCMSCLMNLSHLEDAVEPILYFCPDGGTAVDSRGLDLEKECHRQLPLDRKDSLLRTLERAMLNFLPYANTPTKRKHRKARSAEGEALRWAVGFLRNVTAKEEHANLVSQTEVPHVVVTCVRDSPRPTVEWTKDSTEEMALQVMCNLAQWPESGRVLRSEGAVEAVEPIIGVGGIHDFRATMIMYSLEV